MSNLKVQNSGHNQNVRYSNPFCSCISFNFLFRQVLVHRHRGNFPTRATFIRRWAIWTFRKRRLGQCRLCPSLQHRSSNATSHSGFRNDGRIKIRSHHCEFINTLFSASWLWKHSYKTRGGVLTTYILTKNDDSTRHKAIDWRFSVCVIFIWWIRFIRPALYLQATTAG